MDSYIRVIPSPRVKLGNLQIPNKSEPVNTGGFLFLTSQYYYYVCLPWMSVISKFRPFLFKKAMESLFLFDFIFLRKNI